MATQAKSPLQGIRKETGVSKVPTPVPVTNGICPKKSELVDSILRSQARAERKNGSK